MTGSSPVLCRVGDPALAPSSELAVAAVHVRSLVIGPSDPDGAALGATAQQMLRFAADHADALVRTCALGHFTGSALVVDHQASAVLLLHHRKLQRWLQPGGHADGDANLAAVALREATEETGIVGLQVVLPPVDLDIHEVRPPHEPAHRHLDVRFVVLASVDSEIVGNHESTALRWVPVDQLERYEPDRGLVRLVRRGLRVARTITGAGDHDQPA
jgi:8-oxo-dGTP pyrophosphatase MutT (NUDIX family)